MASVLESLDVSLHIFNGGDKPLTLQLLGSQTPLQTILI